VEVGRGALERPRVERRDELGERPLGELGRRERAQIDLALPLEARERRAARAEATTEIRSSARETSSWRRRANAASSRRSDMPGF
jgi:hypothetical protein